MEIRGNDAAWSGLLQDVEAQCGMTVTLYDPDGAVVLRSGELANNLCKMVQAHPGAVTTVCSVAQQNLGREAQVSGEPAIGECDLGMVKLVVPIRQGDETIGFIGACGARDPQVEVETFLASRTLEVDEDELTPHTGEVPLITPELVQRTVTVVQRLLGELWAGVQKR